jgi:hypothetical protein
VFGRMSNGKNKRHLEHLEFDGNQITTNHSGQIHPMIYLLARIYSPFHAKQF